MRLNYFAVLPVACLFLGTSQLQLGFSQDPAVPVQASAVQASPSVVPPGQVDVRASRAYARVEKTGLGHEHAIEGRVQQGLVRLGAPANAGAIVFDMASFRADTAAARSYVGLSGETSASTQQQVNANMRGKSVLEVAKYPTATFAIDSALPTDVKSRNGNPTYKLRGRFTLHGTTRPMVMDAELLPTQGLDHLRGGFQIKQSSFGITPFTKAFGAIGVADSMTIYGEIFIGRGTNVSQQTINTNPTR
jgi:hypothetical protein